MTTSPQNPPAPRVAIGITGASGSLYADTLLRALLHLKVRTYLVATDTARQVTQTEIPHSLLVAVLKSGLQAGFERDENCVQKAQEKGLGAEDLALLRLFQNQDFYAPLASGSSGATHMAILPCSMGSMGRIAHGLSTCLLERTADVCLKEGRPLVLVPRETPLSLIHVQNMSLLLQAGARIVPASPGFYFQPKTIEDLAIFMAERVLSSLGFSEEIRTIQWNKRSL